MTEDLRRGVRTTSTSDLLRHIDQARLKPDVVADLLELGFDDYDTITELAGERHHQRHAQLKALAAAGTRADPDSIECSIDLLGWRALSTEFSNIDLWLDVAERVSAIRNTIPHHSSTSAEIINQLIEAGRGPSYALNLATAAEGTQRPLDAYGFEPEITRPMFRDLAEAGIRNLAEINLYRSHGLTLSDIIGLAGAGVTAPAIAAAVATGLPADKWLTTLRGMPERWFPVRDRYSKPGITPDSGILAKPGVTWPILRELVDIGWDAETRRFAPSTSWKHDSLAPFTVTEALAAGRAGLTFEEAEKWATAMVTGKRGSEWWDQGQPPLVNHGLLRIGTHLDQILAMKIAGVHPSWIGEFRNCGARSVDDVLIIAEAGITAAIAKTLRSVHGQQRSKHSPKRFRTIVGLLAAGRTAA